MADEMRIPYSAAPHGGFLTIGHGVDCDTAFDDATEAAWFELGRAQIVPSITTANPEHLNVLTTAPMPLWAAAEHARSALTGLPVGTVVAVPVGNRNGYTRRKVSVTLDDTTVNFPSAPQQLHGLPAVVLADLRAMSGAAEAELIDTVELRRPVRARYKVVTTRHDGPKQHRFSLYLPGQPSPLSNHRTVGDARRAAVAYAKHDATGVTAIEIRKETLVNGTDPLVTVARVRVAQRAALRIELCSPKPNVRTVAWVFAGLPVLLAEGDAQ